MNHKYNFYLIREEVLVNIPSFFITILIALIFALEVTYN